MTRKDARELLMQAVFQMEIQKDQSNELLERLIKDKDAEKDYGKYIRGTFETLRKNLEDIDRTINRYSRNWDVKRMPKTDLAILRLAVCEVLYCDNIVDAVAINAAVDMSKKFCNEESRKFINGVLGSVSRNKDA